MAMPSARVSRRRFLAGAAAGAVALPAAAGLVTAAEPAASKTSESLAGLLHASLSPKQREVVCFPWDYSHPKFGLLRTRVGNNWNATAPEVAGDFYTKDQQDLVKQIFGSLHHPEHREKMHWQVEKDLMGQIKNTPSVGFFGTPADKDFEFIYTGHHVTRRCNAHTDKGLGFGGAPIFYGNFAKSFHETKDHEGNPFWYQGLLFNEFYRALDGKQQEKILVGREPRGEKPSVVTAHDSVTALEILRAEEKSVRTGKVVKV